MGLPTLNPPPFSTLIADKSGLFSSAWSRWLALLQQIVVAISNKPSFVFFDLFYGPKQVSTSGAGTATLIAFTGLDDGQYCGQFWIAQHESGVHGQALIENFAFQFEVSSGAATAYGSVSTHFGQAGTASGAATLVIPGNDAEIQVTGSVAGIVNWRAYGGLIKLPL